MFLDPFFAIENDLAAQKENFLTARILFGVVAQDKNSVGWSALGDFRINVTAEDITHTYVPIPNPNPSTSGIRPLAATVGNTVMLLQFIDGTVVCLGRVKV